MSCSEDQMEPGDALDSLDDAVAAAAFRRLVRLLQHRSDAANIDLQGLAGDCRNGQLTVHKPSNNTVHALHERFVSMKLDRVFIQTPDAPEDIWPFDQHQKRKHQHEQQVG